MPDQTPPEPTTDPEGSTASAPRDAPRGGGMSWLIPALTFLVGLLLGAVVMGVSGNGDAIDVAASPTTTGSVVSPTASPSVRPDSTVTIPGSCLEVADSAKELGELVGDAAGAAQEFDASGLSTIVRELQESQTGLEEKADECRSAAGSMEVSPTTTG